jgi:hypothetical protein
LTGRLLALCLAGAVAGLVAACDPSSDGTTPAATPSAAVAGPSAVDRCLVGTWKSIGITGTVAIGGAQITLSGGAGEVITIDAGGAVRTDDSNTAPVGGTAPNGTDYRIVQSGTGTGTIASSGGRMKVTLSQPTTLTVNLYKNGTVIQSQHPGSANDSYTCTAGTSLIITGGGGTVTKYSPA